MSFALAAGAAYAACGPVACDNVPIVFPPAPPSVVLPPAAPAVCYTGCDIGPSCSTCTNPNVQPTTLPGVYSNDYDYSVTSQQNTIGIPYLIPTAAGLLESPTIPLTNAVDQYYATHRVVNNQVVRTAANPPNRSVAYNPPVPAFTAPGYMPGMRNQSFAPTSAGQITAGNQYLGL